MEILILTALSRAPMHGYDLKLELRYKHVRWWAKAEHGHLYAALARLERGKFVRRVPAPAASGGRGRRIYGITRTGRTRLRSALESLVTAPEATYFDIDLVLNAIHTVDRDAALALLEARRAAIENQLGEARQLRADMSQYVPAVGRLIMDHRIDHLAREVEFLATATRVLIDEPTWGPFLRDSTITEFVDKTGVPLEDD